ncbi:hypothetical protein Tco_0316266 [Tanacetum coccineum]
MSVHSYTDNEYEPDPNFNLISKLDVSNPFHLHPNDSAALTALPRCTCQAADDFKKHNQLMKLIQLLMGFDDKYMQIRSSILSRETLPDVRSVYAIISSEESYRVASGSISGTSQRSPLQIPEEDVEPKQIILDPDDHPMWENAKTVAPTSNSVIMQLDIDDNFVINNTVKGRACFENVMGLRKVTGLTKGKCHGHGLTKGAIIQVFYHGLDESTQAILDKTAEGIFLYKTQNQAFQFFDNNGDNSRLMEKLEAPTVKMDSQLQSLKKEIHEMRNNYNNSGGDHASKNDDTPMCERHEANYIQYEDYQNQDSHNSFSRQSHYDPNDSKKSLTELNNDVRNDLEDFKIRIRSMRTDYDKLYDKDDGKTTGVLPKKKSKPVNQEPQSKIDFEK